MLIPSEYLGWFKAGLIVGLDIAFLLWLILEAYEKEIGEWINRILNKIS